MALDPNIALQGRVPSLMQALQSGIQGAGALKQAPFIQQLLQQRAQAGQFQQQQAEQEAAQAQADKKKAATIQAGQFINRLTGEMINQSPEDRQATVAQNADFIQSLGQDPASVDISDEGVNRSFKATSVFSQQVDPGLDLERERLRLQEKTIDDRRALAESEANRAGLKREAVLEADTRLKPNLAKQEALAKDSAKLSTEIFGRVDNIGQNIENMREGIKLIDSGAATGPVSNWLPSFTDSTVKLDNLKNRLGLDVIGSVTFGALSASELKTAFDTAVPQNLRGEALKEWFSERITAQEKLMSSLEEAGIFLSEDGATIPKLMAKRRSERKASDQSQGSPAQSIIEVDF